MAAITTHPFSSLAAGFAATAVAARLSFGKKSPDIVPVAAILDRPLVSNKHAVRTGPTHALKEMIGC
jgi:hypothetical protein